jgi:hypothetical protein
MQIYLPYVTIQNTKPAVSFFQHRVQPCFPCFQDVAAGSWPKDKLYCSTGQQNIESMPRVVSMKPWQDSVLRKSRDLAWFVCMNDQQESKYALYTVLQK